MHHALYKCGNLAPDAPALRAAWAPLFEKHQVDIVFTGHEYTFSRTRLIDDYTAAGARGADGLKTQYIVQGASGGGTASFPASCPQVIAKSRLPSYSSINLSGNTMRVLAVGSDDAILDELVLTKP